MFQADEVVSGQSFKPQHPHWPPYACFAHSLISRSWEATQKVSVHDIHTMNNAKCAEEDCTITWNTYIKLPQHVILFLSKEKLGRVCMQRKMASSVYIVARLWVAFFLVVAEFSTFPTISRGEEKGEKEMWSKINHQEGKPAFKGT